MPENLHNALDLPPANGYTPSEQALRIYAAQQAQDAAAVDGVDFDTTSEPVTASAYQALKASQATATVLAGSRLASAEQSTMGILASNVSTKIEEGARSMLSVFGGTGPFDKIGAKASSFTTYAADFAKTSASGVTGAVSSLFGKKDAYAVGATIGSTGIKTSTDISAAGINSVVGKERPDSRDHLFSLTSKQTGEMVEFLVMPEVVENRDVDYEAVAPIQFPGAFQKYKGTGSVVWTINATLISRTTAEATQNLLYLNRLRGWTMPYFGENTAAAFPNMSGAPPDVLTFKGLRKSMIGPVPVVIKSLNWNWPKDVDYIPAYDIFPQGQGDESASATIPFPTVMQIAINMIESISTAEFNRFSLRDYQLGDMKNAFGRMSSETKSQMGATSPTTETEAQTILPNSLRGANGYVPTESSVVLPNSLRGGNGYVPPAISERVTAPFKSGGGGDFGGGGASGDW